MDARAECISSRSTGYARIHKIKKETDVHFCTSVSFCPINKNHRGKIETTLSGKSDFIGGFALEKALHIIHNKGKHSR